jgi:hypothetical protein
VACANLLAAISALLVLADCMMTRSALTAPSEVFAAGSASTQSVDYFVGLRQRSKYQEHLRFSAEVVADLVFEVGMRSRSSTVV